MANQKPYLSSDDIVEYIKLSMAFPIDQSTFTYDNILTLVNREMMMSAVPQVMESHEEYFAYKLLQPMLSNISRYQIPNRAIGMVLRDLKYSDNQGNYYDMGRVSPEDKAFFQSNTGVNQVISHYYLEGNDIVLTPMNNTSPTGNLNFFIFLRPNFLVRNDRACTIENFVKDITITDYTLIQPGDTITIVTDVQTVNPTIHTFIAINTNAQTIASNAVSTDGVTSVVTTNFNHDLPVGTNFTVVITGVAGSIPTINGTFQASSLGPNTFSVPVNVTTGGTGGSYFIEGQFQVDTSNAVTATNLNTAMLLSGLDTTVTGGIVTMSYDNISDSFITAQTVTNNPLDGIIDIDLTHLFVHFNQLPVTYQNPDTQVVTDLYTDGCLVDFLQTLPGHKTYNFDVTLEEILPGNIGKFSVRDLQTYQNNSSGGPLTYYPIVIGDYICLQNECIIPGIPPELHSALAERGSGRILMAIGDREGYAVSQAKIAEMNASQFTMINSRVEGSVPKVFNRNNLLRMGKRTVRRRFL